MTYIYITGGVISGIGKGTFGSSLGYLLKLSGKSVNYIKIDPYINTNAGYINPYEHGEVFVLEDGSEVDLDFGCYERFLDMSFTSKNSITTGKVYSRVISKSNNGEYKGDTVQIVPHITDDIKERLKSCETIIEGGKPVDYVIVELGGTINDMETLPFIEAIRQFSKESNRESIFFHLSYIPFITSTREHKTKPTQETIKKIRELGIVPDVLVLRSAEMVSSETLEKVYKATGVKVMNIKDCKSVYNVPRVIYNKVFKVENIVSRKFGEYTNLGKWLEISENLNIPLDRFTERKKLKEINVCIVGKYINLSDCYISIIRAIDHAALYNNRNPIITFMDAESFNYSRLKKVDAVIIAPGFGKRGLEGKIRIANYCRVNRINTLGICFGFQAMVIEFARNVCGIKDATSEEITSVGSLIFKRANGLYSGVQEIRYENGIVKLERNRNNYELNNDYISILEENGLKLYGESSSNCQESKRTSLKYTSCYKGVQYHPEYSSRPFNAHVLFIELLREQIPIYKRVYNCVFKK